jgi:hypothetical protein
MLAGLQLTTSAIFIAFGDLACRERVVRALSLVSTGAVLSGPTAGSDKASVPCPCFTDYCPGATSGVAISNTYP